MEPSVSSLVWTYIWFALCMLTKSHFWTLGGPASGLWLIYSSKYHFGIIYLFFGCATQHVGSQFPDQGSKSHPQHWKCRVLTTEPPGKSQYVSFLDDCVRLVHILHCWIPYPLCTHFNQVTEKSNIHQEFIWSRGESHSFFILSLILLVKWTQWTLVKSGGMSSCLFSPSEPSLINRSLSFSISDMEFSLSGQ